MLAKGKQSNLFFRHLDDEEKSFIVLVPGWSWSSLRCLFEQTFSEKKIEF